MGVVAATEAMIVATRDSSSSRGGSRPGIVRARSVLPDPGGPIMSMQWPPPRAISSPRRASSWPRTSARSGPAGVATPDPPVIVAAWATPSSGSTRTSSPSSTRGGATLARPRRVARSSSAASASVAAATTSTFSASDASTAPSAGTMTRRTRRLPRAATMGSRPGHETQVAAQRQLAQHGPAPGSLDLLRADHDPERDRQIERRAALAKIRGRQIDGDAAGRILVSTVADGPAHPLTRFLQRRVGQADDGEARAGPGATSTSTRTSRPSRPWRVADRSEASTPPKLRVALNSGLSGPSLRPGAPQRALDPRPIERPWPPGDRTCPCPWPSRIPACSGPGPNPTFVYMNGAPLFSAPIADRYSLMIW